VCKYQAQRLVASACWFACLLPLNICFLLSSCACAACLRAIYISPSYFFMPIHACQL
jgi:hypothetical protein